jgi:hypothetical protein
MSLIRSKQRAACAFLGAQTRLDAGPDRFESWDHDLPYDRHLSDLIGQLSTRSDDFRVRWAARDVHAHVTGTKRIHHPEVGDLDLPFESTPLPADPGQHLVIYSPAPSTPSYTALQILASWAAQPNPAHDSSSAAGDTGVRLSEGD